MAFRKEVKKMPLPDEILSTWPFLLASYVIAFTASHTGTFGLLKPPGKEDSAAPSRTVGGGSVGGGVRQPCSQRPS